MRRTASAVVVLASVALLSGACGGGARGEVGTVTGLRTSMSFGEAAMGGEVESMEIGALIVELNDGTEVEAACPKELLPEGLPTQGDQVRVELEEESDTWKVIEYLGSGE